MARLDSAVGGEGSRRIRRAIDLASKAWTYFIASLERPRDIPFLLSATIGKRAHPGQLIRLARHRKWLTTAGINTAIDVGGHTGQFASALRALLPNAWIYSFEPLPDCHAVLSRRLERTGNFKAFQVALGESPGHATLWRSSFSESSSILPMSDLHKTAFPWSARNVPVDVKIETLDVFLPEMELRPNVLLKLDVQGFEAKVLRGALQVLERVAYVLAEVSFQPLYEGQASFGEICGFLDTKGFSYAGTLDQMQSPVDGSILQADVLFTRVS